MDNVYLARQPILDKESNIYAYEILYRDADKTSHFENNMTASASVVNSILNKFGTKSLLGEKKAFIKIDEKFLLNDIIFSVPKDLFVFSLFSQSVISEKMVEQIVKLHTNGYTLAINDTNLDMSFIEKFSDVLEYFSFVKINFDVFISEDIASLILQLKKTDTNVIATKIEDIQTYELAKKLGCDYYEGYYFSKPVILENAQYEPFQMNVLKLYNLLMQDVNIDEITTEFENNPEITVQLLQFINSAAFSFRKKISSIHHVLVLLGRIPLSQWLMLLIYSKSISKVQQHSPLMMMVLNRTFLMKNILNEIEPDVRSNMLGEAYLVGVLSLMDTLFGMQIEDILQRIDISDPVKDAILNDAGELGEIYAVVRATESFDVDEIIAFERRHTLKTGSIKNIVLKAIEYTNEFNNPQE